MTVFLLIAFAVFAIYMAGKKKKPVSPKAYHAEPADKEIAALVSRLQQKDAKHHINTNNVIDVTGQSHKIDIGNGLKPYPGVVPYSAHQYVYSHIELNGATGQKRAFYSDFKTRFLNGEYYDLEGNANYAFILLFDLINDYDRHKNFTRLENQLR